eukprot:13629979-Alexandrium_andersonii.AAC.1
MQLGDGRCGLTPPCLDLALGDLARWTGCMHGGYCDFADTRGDGGYYTARRDRDRVHVAWTNLQ